jgi:hypothetical protein
VIWILAILLIAAWPPAEGPSLGVRVIRWMADPSHTLPTLPAPLPMGLGDDGDAVAAHDFQEAEYYRLTASSGTIRMRLRLKAVEDPFEASTERQVLAGVGILGALGVWRLGGRREAGES